MRQTFTGAEAWGHVPFDAEEDRVHVRRERCVCGIEIVADGNDMASWQPTLARHYRTASHLRWEARRG